MVYTDLSDAQRAWLDEYAVGKGLVPDLESIVEVRVDEPAEIGDGKFEDLQAVYEKGSRKGQRVWWDGRVDVIHTFEQTFTQTIDRGVVVTNTHVRQKRVILPDAGFPE